MIAVGGVDRWRAKELAVIATLAAHLPGHRSFGRGSQKRTKVFRQPQFHLLFGLVAGIPQGLAHDVVVLLLHVAGVVTVIGSSAAIGDGLQSAPALQRLVEKGTVVVRVQALQSHRRGVFQAFYCLLGPPMSLIQQTAWLYPTRIQLHCCQGESEMTVGVAPVMAYKVYLVVARLHPCAIRWR